MTSAAAARSNWGEGEGDEIDGDVDLDLVFAALADPTRRAILERLARGEATITELGAPFDLSQPTISSHVQKLEHAGLLTKERAQKLRVCHLNPAPLIHAARWIGGYRSFFEKSLDRLEGYVAELLAQEQAAAAPTTTPAPKRRQPKE